MMDNVGPSYDPPGAAVSGSEILIIGDGIIGLAVAAELARRGSVCRIAGARNPGAASMAAAGLLSPSLGPLPPIVEAFFQASLAAYPAFVERLREFDPALRLVDGLLQLGDQSQTAPGAERLSAAELARVEPALAGLPGALLHPRDGAVDNVRLVAALRAAVGVEPRVTMREDRVVSLERGPRRCAALTATGARMDADVVVIAAGAWAPQIEGLPRRLPVEPLKGQMLALDASPLRHAVYGESVYLVPRISETVVGATTERAGFDLTTSYAVIDELRDAAVGLCPGLADARVSRAWAGLRPATPDMLPILGRDADDPRVIYACGHSKNGILLAPATADVIASLALGGDAGLDLAPFAITRFQGS